jgi:hypothetical protein
MSAANSGRRLSLTKSQLSSPVGQELLDLLLNIGKDGVLEYEELEQLSDFLNRSKNSEVPGILFLFNLMIAVCEDQKITSEELIEIQLGIERVLPPATRADIRRSRLALVPPPSPEPATERQLEYIHILGGTPPPNLSKWDASELIDQLKQNPPASPRQIMFLRFWGRTDLIGCSRDQVTAWMSDFIDEDERRKHAWNRYKAEVGDDGSQRDPSSVPIGIGKDYLSRAW